MNTLIAVDDWKVAIFLRGLRKAGFDGTERPGVTADTRFISVEIGDSSDLVKLAIAVRNCNAAAAASKN